MQQWYWAKNNRNVGPLSFDVLRRLAAAGRLPQSDLILRENGRKWVTAASIPGLFDGGRVPKWYYACGGEARGPLTSGNLRRLATAGRLRPTDMVMKEGGRAWVAARSVRGLFADQNFRTSAAPVAPPVAQVLPDSQPARTAPKFRSPGQTPVARRWLPPALAVLVVAMAVVGALVFGFRQRASGVGDVRAAAPSEQAPAAVAAVSSPTGEDSGQSPTPQQTTADPPALPPEPAGQPKPRGYALTTAPLSIRDHLSDLGDDPLPPLLADERILLAAVWKSKAADAALAPVDRTFLIDALLFASGVSEPEGRRRYREQIDALTDKAREATKNARDPYQRAEQLLTFLHSGVMSKGYQEDQTSLAAVFDTGKFNCVSATALYYLVGTDLGLDLRIISIPGNQFFPGHATLEMVDGTTRIHVETTNPDGFDWQTKIHRPGVLVIGPPLNLKDGHEVDGPGLAAMIYNNRGVALGKEPQPRWMDAVGCYLSALSLDPADSSTTQNLLNTFANWGGKQVQAGKFEDALRTLHFGLTFSPQWESMRHNYSVAWTQYIETALASGKDRDALAILRRAAAATNDKQFQNESLWFEQLGEQALKDQGWEAALAVVDRGSSVLPEAEAGKLCAWRTSVFRQWSQALLDKKDVDGSLRVLARAYDLAPKDRGVVDGIAFHTQEALSIVENRDGRAAMLQHYEALRKQFPDIGEVVRTGSDYAWKVVAKLANAGRFEEALESVENDYRPLLPAPEERTKLGAFVYNKWASAAIDAKDWDRAINVYKTGLKKYPDSNLLQQNLRYCEQMKERT